MLTTEAIVLISHFDVRPGHLHLIRGTWASIILKLEGAKPGTAGYLGYLTDGGAELTIVQVFPDGRAMEAHLTGTDGGIRAAYEHIEPAGWEVYGNPPDEILAQLGESALAAGVDLVIQRQPLGGFLRLGA